jgi:restriction system protein
MARRTSFIGVMNAMAREAARVQRVAEANKKRAERERLQAIRNAERQAAAAAKEAKQRYLEDRINEVEDKNAEIARRMEEFKGILSHTLAVDDRIDFDTLRIYEKFPDFAPPEEIAKAVSAPLEETYLNFVKQPSFLSKLVPGWSKRHGKAIALARERYASEFEKYVQAETSRKERYDKLKEEYDRSLESFNLKVQNRNLEVDELKRTYEAGDPVAVSSYNSMVLERSSYPEGFPQEFRIAYVPESRELVIDYELPAPNIVPKVEEYRYAKSKDVIEEKLRKSPSKKEVYQDIVASVALRTCHETLEADQAGVLDVVVFNGFVQTVDPATGKDIRPYIISVRTTKKRFQEIDLSRIEKAICLRNLGAQVSPRASEVQAVKPIVEFNMVDRRFVEQSDILADLDARPNLMDLNPFEFENLISNLFKQIGLETKLTRSSHDGGVDVVAYDSRPLLGGKVVIQAKRYKNTVGVSAVRDLYGTMMNEGANKGILVTTSGYGQSAFDFAKDKPIELMDGGQLLFLLDQVGVQARIIFPEIPPSSLT